MNKFLEMDFFRDEIIASELKIEKISSEIKPVVLNEIGQAKYVCYVTNDS